MKAVEKKTALKYKLRFWAIKQILEQYTDEKNELSIQDILNCIAEIYPNHNVKRDTVMKDIKYLQELGFHIVESRKGTAIHYQLINREFDIHELRLLVDAVISSRSLSARKTEQLVDKLKMLASQHEAKHLANDIYIGKTVKMENENIHHWISALHEAVANRYLVAFKYGKYNLNKKIVFNRDGDLYHIEPYELVWNNDYYYLIGRKPGEEQWRHYRVDRIYDLTIDKQKTFNRLPFDIGAYMDTLFHMYSGDVEEVILHVHNHLVNAYLDKFGTSLAINPINDNYFEVRFKAANSDGLLRWVLTWGSDAIVISPLSLKDRIRQEAMKMVSHYTL
jgi:predicted DNA-binding transcriptional regulator YafY